MRPVLLHERSSVGPTSQRSMVGFLQSLLVAAQILVASGAHAQTPVGPPLAGPVEVESSGEASDNVVPRITSPTLKRDPGWSLGVHGQVGLAVLAQGDRGAAHAVAGGLARLQIGYFEIGGVIEQTDQVIDSWRSYGGFVGAFLPFERWVDVDCAVGASLRRHKNPEARFGPGGYSITSPALTLGVGISDRTSEGEIGVRLGARLVAALDLGHHEAAWRYQSVREGPTQFATGTSTVGGFSMGAMVTAGFDIARATRRVPRVR